ncbi:uncharacterized protein LOC128756882 isoform X1 [Synchiropus splendidus]|uniref:uncharacterized protein LOC128756882 isoform X1 n=1 Tax=Synchiropus splendidus TaxID=270530 RepID=UPI00237E3E92|nr:uncharacterized protein LOC128756882 isoform X1 [Synchiropus splendidus]XP_053717653.1 uncharacterized protein LOC128756882 isoform X1 [Synchiropus splendidus]XP_053717654.1 uncharacterized protein LOC128756882 isoform X1 [Synchiropus splendidus]XP_053717655.1 uncharacterized protein LOC128756882 isoform X1 [Synchiropus splendidus]XP_053717657.1 uncharacterized protein LOC128756882 isoform X1 [Synchiropus splendidus]
MTGTNLKTKSPLLTSLLRGDGKDVMQATIPKSASKKVSDQKLSERSKAALRGNPTPLRTNRGQPCVSADSVMLTDSQILNHINTKIAFFLSGATKPNRSHVNPSATDARTHQPVCSSNTSVHVNGRCGLSELHRVSRDGGADFGTNSAQGNHWTAPIADSPSSGRQGGHTQPKPVEQSLSRDNDLQLKLSSFPATGRIRCDNSDDLCGYNISLRKNNQEDFSMAPTFHMKDTIHYPLNTLKELIVSLEKAETKAEMNNFTKVLVNDYWNGDVDNLHIFASTEYPQIMLDVAATCTKHEGSSPVVLTTCSGLNMEKLTEAQLCFSKNCSTQTPLKSAPLSNVKDLPGKDKNVLPQVTKDQEAAVDIDKVSSVEADVSKDKCSQEFKSTSIFEITTACNPHKEGYEEVPVSETKQDSNKPIYEDISDCEKTQSPLFQNLEDISDEDSQKGVMKDMAFETHERPNQKPMSANGCSEVNAETQQQLCDTDEDEWTILPLSVGSLDFLPKAKPSGYQSATCWRGDGPETPKGQDNPTEGRSSCPRSFSSPLPVFDTIESFEKAQMAHVGIFEDCKAGVLFEENSFSPASEAEDSCDTEDSCDYSSECSGQNRLTFSRKLLENLRPNSAEKRSLSGNGSDVDVNGLLSPRSKRGQCFKKLKRLMTTRPKKAKTTPHKEVIVIDSDSDDEIDEPCKINRQRSGPTSLNISSTDERQRDDMRSNRLTYDSGNNSSDRLLPEASKSGSVSLKRPLAVACQKNGKSTARKSTGAHTVSQALERIKRARRTDSTNSEEDLETWKKQNGSIKNTPPRRKVCAETLSQGLVKRGANIIPSMLYKIGPPPSGRLLLTAKGVRRKKVVRPLSPLTTESSSDELEEALSGGTKPQPVIKGQCKKRNVMNTEPHQDVLPTSSGRLPEVSGPLATPPIPKLKSTSKTKSIKIQRSISSPAKFDLPSLPSSTTPQHVPAHKRIRDDWRSQHIQTYKERRHSLAAALPITVKKPSEKQRAPKRRPCLDKNLTPLMKKTKKMCMLEKKRSRTIEASFPVDTGFKWGGKPSGSTQDFPWSQFGSPPRVYD